MHRPNIYRKRCVLYVGLAITFTTTFLPAHTFAATYDEASWYYTNFNMENNLKIASGSGVKIALIDGSIDPSVPELANAKIETHPSACLLNGSSDPVSTTTDATHGTQMAVFIAGNGIGNWNGQGGRGIAPGATILYYRNSTIRTDGVVGTECRDTNGASLDLYDRATANAITDAVAHGARVVNMSFGTKGEMPYTAYAIGSAERRGVVFVGATDDKPTPFANNRLPYPGLYNGVVLMNSLSKDSKPGLYAAMSNLVVMMAPGDDVVVGGINPTTNKWDSSGVFGGSSMAAAYTSAIVADAMSKYPNATGNQIIQLMLRTTGGTYHEIPTRSYDGFGFGTVSLTTMLEHDPTKLPDVNPLLRDGAEPSTQDILGTTTAASKPNATSPAKTHKQSPLLLSILCIFMLLLTVLVVVFIRRRRPPAAVRPEITPWWRRLPYRKKM